jgi:hypothetical protein
VRKRSPSHPAAIAIRVTACANDEMLGHEAMLEANTKGSTSNVGLEIRMISMSSRSPPFVPDINGATPLLIGFAAPDRYDTPFSCDGALH